MIQGAEAEARRLKKKVTVCERLLLSAQGDPDECDAGVGMRTGSRREQRGWGRRYVHTGARKAGCELDGKKRADKNEKNTKTKK